jgi:hypothetical protein
VKRLIAVAAFAFALTGCTAQERARHFGGTETVALPPNTKLIVATWKDSQLWYLTRSMHANEAPETYELREKSTLGMLEGKIVFIESRK